MTKSTHPNRKLESNEPLRQRQTTEPPRIVLIRPTAPPGYRRGCAKPMRASATKRRHVESLSNAPNRGGHDASRSVDRNVQCGGTIRNFYINFHQRRRFTLKDSADSSSSGWGSSDDTGKEDSIIVDSLDACVDSDKNSPHASFSRKVPRRSTVIVSSDEDSCEEVNRGGVQKSKLVIYYAVNNSRNDSYTQSCCRSSSTGTASCSEDCLQPSSSS